MGRGLPVPAEGSANSLDGLPVPAGGSAGSLGGLPGPAGGPAGSLEGLPDPAGGLDFAQRALRGRAGYGFCLPVARLAWGCPAGAVPVGTGVL